MTERRRSDRTTTSIIIEPEIAGPDAFQASLVGLAGSVLGSRFLLARHRTTIGRALENDISLDEPGVSRLHAVIEQTPAGLTVSDENSTNGTYVNDERINRWILSDGDQIRVGPSVFKFIAVSQVEGHHYNEIFRLTATDELTGAYNRRHLFTSLERELARALRHDRDLAVLMLDIDHFKRLNDTYGHTAGDAVLAGIAERVEPMLGEDDIFARYGGEEFAVVLLERDAVAAASMADQICRRIAGVPFEVEGNSLQVTVSIGVSDIEELRHSQRTSPETLDMEKQLRYLIGLADAKLYEAKSLGRNRVVF